ncbi:hypothetical protein ACWDFH_26260 [Streptomyces kronopolitis]
MPKKPLFSGLSFDDKTSAQLYNEEFARQQAELSAKAHLSTPPTPPMRRPRHGQVEYVEPKAAVELITTRSSKNGVRPSKGTPSVPAGLRKSAGETQRQKSHDGRRRARSLVGYPTRAKDSEKIAYNGRVGMTARPRMTNEKRSQIAESVSVRTVETLRLRTIRADVEANFSRTEAKRHLADALGRERDAKSRGDMVGAAAAREDVKKLRKLSTYKGN